MTKPNPEGFRIAAVCRRAGLKASTIRVWEKRYSVVTPERTDSGHRVYTEQDVQQLTLIQRLIERGDTMSELAQLSMETLQQRLQHHRTPVASAAGGKQARFHAFGEQVAMRLHELPPPGMEAGFWGANIIEDHSGIDTAPAEVDTCILCECDNVMDRQANALLDLNQRLKPSVFILVQRFAPRDLQRKLESAGVVFVRAPIAAQDLRDLITSRWRDAVGELPSAQAITGAAHPPIYHAEQLRRVAMIKPTLDCECPQHLAEILQSLNAFEGYSEACEDRSPEDAKIHALLRTTTAQARSLMETALTRVLQADKIDIDRL